MRKNVLWLFAFSADLWQHSAQEDKLHSLFKHCDGKLTSWICVYEHPCRWTVLPVMSDMKLWSGVSQASVQHQTRTKHQWRNIYQPRPKGRFTAPVVPPCLKDDTVYIDCLEQTENKYFLSCSSHRKGQWVVNTIAVFLHTHKKCVFLLSTQLSVDESHELITVYSSSWSLM